MGTEVAVISAPLPAYYQQRAEKAKASATAAAGGIKFGSFTRLSISGGKFHLIKEKVVRLITDPKAPPGVVLPLMRLDVVMLGSNASLSKQYYAGKYVIGSTEEPDCSSDDGRLPDSGVAHPVHSNCVDCPMNKWGSKKTPEGKDTKACSDNKRVVLVPDTAMDFEPIALNITPASLTTWGKFVIEVAKTGRDVQAIVIALTFDPKKSFPKLNFNFVRDLTPEELAIVDQRAASPEVKALCEPRADFVPALPAPAVATEPIVPLAQNYAPAAEAVRFASPATVVPTAFPQPIEPPPPAPNQEQPLAAQPAHVQAAVNAAGGMDNGNGYAVYRALTAGQAPQANSVAVESAKRHRRTKAEIAADAVAATLAVAVVAAANTGTTTVTPNAPPAPPPGTGPAATGTLAFGTATGPAATGTLAFGTATGAAAPIATTAAAPVTPAPSFISAPAGNVVAGPGSIDLSKMLDAALNVPASPK